MESQKRKSGANRFAYFLPLIFALFLSGCTITFPSKKEEVTAKAEPEHIEHSYSGDHPTAMIRNMWSFCMQASIKKQPQMPPQWHWLYCDCICDRTRMEYTVIDYGDKGGKGKPEVLNSNFGRFAQECIMMMNANPGMVPQSQGTSL